MTDHSGMSRRPEQVIPGTSHTGDESHIFRDLFRTHQAVSNAFTRCVGAPASRIGLLRLLAVRQGQLGTNQLARRLNVDAAGVTRQVKEMEAAGLVTRTPHATDGRRTVVQLTRSGLEAFRAIHDHGHGYERALAAEVSKRDIATARRVLRAMREVVLRSVNMDEEDLP
jgi:DNA-binding MarR family transcriptional regulator